MAWGSENLILGAFAAAAGLICGLVNYTYHFQPAVAEAVATADTLSTAEHSISFVDVSHQVLGLNLDFAHVTQSVMFQAGPTRLNGEGQACTDLTRMYRDFGGTIRPTQDQTHTYCAATPATATP